MLGAVRLCLLSAVCIVWHASASPTMILRSRHHRNVCATSETIHSNETMKTAAFGENQPSVSLSEIFKTLESVTVKLEAGPDKNQLSEIPLVTNKSRVSSDSDLTDSPDDNQSSESAFTTNKNSDSSDGDLTDLPHDNEPSEIPFITPQYRDYSSADLEVTTETMQWLLTPTELRADPRLRRLLNLILSHPYMDTFIVELEPIHMYNCSSRPIH